MRESKCKTVVDTASSCCYYLDDNYNVNDSKHDDNDNGNEENRI